MVRKYLTLIFTLHIALTSICFSQSNIHESEIKQNELKKHIEFLASDSLKGRFPGTDEDRIAANYIKNDMLNNGLSPVLSKDPQKFEIIHNIELADNNFLKFNNTTYQINKDFLPSSISSNSNITSEIVFVGYGFDINEDSIQWNDYSNVSVKGKWVLILKGDPENDNPESQYIAYSDPLTKSLSAIQYGATGVLLVSGTTYDEKDIFSELSSPKGNLNIPVIQIKRELANQILETKETTIEQLEDLINKEKKSHIINIDNQLSASVDLKIDKKYTFNAICQITTPGTDEYIVIGAHYDHLGYGGNETGSRKPDTVAIHYGADDNASGVAAMLELAEKMYSIKDDLNKNILFIAFGAEENGLLGSKYFINNSPIDIEKIKAMINLDMIGRMRDNAVQVGGTGTSPNHEEILNDVNTNYNFNLGFSPEGYGPSDHSSFYSKDIPVFFISTGPHLDYHTPFDNPENINYEGLVQISKFTFDLAYNLATREENLAFQEAGPKMESSRYAHGKRFKVTLGIMPDFSGVEKRGLRADIIIKDKPAYKAGMKDGDIITAINGKPISDIYSYMSRLSKLKSGQTINVEIIRNDEKKVLLIQL